MIIGYPRHILPTLGLVLCLVLGLSWPVAAHSPLTSLVPADGAKLTTAPATIDMGFRDASRLIRFDLARDEDGTTIDLDDAHLMVEAVDHVVALPPLAAGQYTASWRAMGEDGHVIKGRFSFTIAPQ